VNPADGSRITKQPGGDPRPTGETTTNDHYRLKQRSPQNIEPDKENSNNNEQRFFMDTRPPKLSSSLTSAVTNSDTVNSTAPKPTQLSKKELKQCNIKLDKDDDIENRLSIYHQNIRGLKGKISEFLLTLPTEALHLMSHKTSLKRL
jgi:hypothetical protein